MHLPDRAPRHEAQGGAGWNVRVRQGMQFPQYDAALAIGQQLQLKAAFEPERAECGEGCVGRLTAHDQPGRASRRINLEKHVQSRKELHGGSGAGRSHWPVEVQTHYTDGA